MDGGTTVATVAGTGYSASPNWNENGLATQAYIGTPTGLARAPDGTLYIAADGMSGGAGGRIRRVGVDGIITTVAGLPSTVAKNSGDDALHAAVYPTGLAIGPDSSVYFTEYQTNQIWRIAPGPAPKVYLVAGSGVASPGR